MKQPSRTRWTNLIAGHYSALTVFFRRRIARIADAEDLVQEVYWRLLRTEHDRAPDREIQNPEAYLFTVAENLLHEHYVLQRRFAQHVELSDVAPALLSIQDTVESAVDRDILDRQLRTVFERLSARHRAVFVMHYRDGLTYPQIADKLGVSTNMIKKYIVKALAACRNELFASQGGEP